MPSPLDNNGGRSPLPVWLVAVLALGGAALVGLPIAKNSSSRTNLLASLLNPIKLLPIQQPQPATNR